MRSARLLVLVGALACQDGSERCDPVAIGRDHGVVGAFDCGVQEGDDTDVMTCVAQHLQDALPCVGVTQVSGAQDLVTQSWVVDGTTVTVFQGRFTSCTSDGCVGEVEQLDCPDPVVSFDEDGGHITCTWPAAPCGPIVCGGSGDGC